MSSTRRDGSSTGVVGGLLALSLVIALLLALQTQYAVRSHRETVESVLSSCSALAAEELVRRAANEVGYQGYLRILEALPKAAIAAAGDAATARAARLVESSFLVEESGPRFLDAAPPDAVTSWLAARLAATPTDHPLPYRVAGTVIEGRARLFVWSSRPGAPRMGFEVALEALPDSFGRALSRGPLLPSALTHGDVGNDALSVSIRDLAGKERFRAGPPRFPTATRVPFGDAYGSVLEGFTAEVSIDPGVAPRLVPGGLPRSRLPVLLGLLGVSFALALLAGLLVRRERELVSLREAFVTGVSHELRTPLAQIRLFAETLLLQRTRSREEELHALSVIDREARRLAHLVANVLAFSNARSGPAPGRASIELGALARETLEAFRPLAAVRGVTLALEMGGDGPRVRADHGAISQILVNLLDNAVKYGPAGQTVTVRLRSASAGARLEVDDRGPGVPPKERRRIFERFARLPRDAASGVVGAGIGLTVVRELAEAHGGRAYVEDGPEGGARFVVELP